MGQGVPKALNNDALSVFRDIEACFRHEIKRSRWEGGLADGRGRFFHADRLGAGWWYVLSGIFYGLCLSILRHSCAYWYERLLLGPTGGFE